MNEKNELSSHAARLLDRAREVPVLDGERRRQMKRAVLASTLSSVGSGEEPSLGASQRKGIAAALRHPFWPIIAVTALSALVGIPWAISKSSNTPPPTLATTPSNVAPPAAVAAPTMIAPARSIAVAATIDVPTLPSPHALASVKKTTERPARKETEARAPETIAEAASSAPAINAASSLQEEVRLVRGADAAVSAQDPARALTLLAEHERKFPQGMLAAERDMLVVIALCAAGRTTEAVARADRFREHYPHSPLQDRLQHSCARPGEP